MKLTPIAPNQTELKLNNGTIVFFSYETPVAVYDSESCNYFRTSKKFSTTTSRHLNRWCGDLEVKIVDQSVIEDFVSNLEVILSFNFSSYNN